MASYYFHEDILWVDTFLTVLPRSFFGGYYVHFQVQGHPCKICAASDHLNHINNCIGCPRSSCSREPYNYSCMVHRNVSIQCTYIYNANIDSLKSVCVRREMKYSRRSICSSPGWIESSGLKNFWDKEFIRFSNFCSEELAEEEFIGEEFTRPRIILTWGYVIRELYIK